MKSELDIIADVAQKLEKIGIQYMLTGSVAMNYYAEPRMTRDIDLVVVVGSDVANLMTTDYDGQYVDRWKAELGVGELLKELGHE